MEIGVGRHDLVVLLQRQDSPRVGQRMDHDGGVLPRFDDFVEIADRAISDGHRQRAVVPDGAVGLQQIAAGKVGGGHVFMRGDRDQGLGQAPCHVFDKPGFAAPGRPLQHDGQALGEGGLKHRDFVADGLIIRLGRDSVGIEVHAHLHGIMRGESRPPARRLPPLREWGSASIALWARHGLGARKSGVRERLDHH